MERVLTEGQLNRALLARQLLLSRARLPVPRALERMGGIQNQYAPNAYIRLAACLEGFQRETLRRALERRTVVQGTLMRSTIHLVSARDYWLFAAGTRQALRDWVLRAERITGRDLAQRSRRLHAALAGGPRSAKDLGELGQGFLGHAHELVRVPPSGTWERRRADLLARAEDWLGPCSASEAEGLAHLVRSYLGGFGPAPLSDVSSWAGVPVAVLERAAATLRLRRFRDEQGRLLLDIPRAPLPRADTPAPVRFLPTWDAVLLVHARRTGVLPEEYRSLVFSQKNPPSVPTFLVDGRVAGAWRLGSERLELEPFEPLSTSVRRQLSDEARRLASFMTGDGRASARRAR